MKTGQVSMREKKGTHPNYRESPIGEKRKKLNGTKSIQTMGGEQEELKEFPSSIP